MALKHNSVTVCGHYGYQTNQIDGQTIKTRVLKDAFVDFLGEANVQVVDSTMFSRHPVRFFFEARKGFKECSLVVMLPGVRGLHMFLPLFLYWKRKWSRQLQYVVIGGWLPDLLQRNRWLRNQCAQLDGIYVEMKAMAQALSGLGLLNVIVIPNYRKFDYESKNNFTLTTIPIKLVVYSRIFRNR